MKLRFDFGDIKCVRYQRGSIRRFLFRFAISIASFGLLASDIVAGPYSNMFVFGDSLSDIGNLAKATIGLYPGPSYFDDRFSNGPVYSEMLAFDLGLGPLLPSHAGGGSHAFGRAQTTGTGGYLGLIIKDIDEQVDGYLSATLADPEALYVMFAGSNDLLNGVTDVAGPVASLVSDLDRLIAANARNFLVMNLPLLGSAPRFNGDPDESATMTALALDFNNALASALDDLELARPESTIFRLDVAGLISNIISDPGKFGMTNVMDSAAPGLAPGDASYDTSLIANNPDEYLFWDDLHPTTAAHAILAERAYAAVRWSADFNFDGDVDNADFTRWQAGFGTMGTASIDDGDADGDNDVDGNDFILWQRQYGIGLNSHDTAAVPEPASGGWLLALFVLALACREKGHWMERP